jgi:hypothetical protein
MFVDRYKEQHLLIELSFQGSAKILPIGFAK